MLIKILALAVLLSPSAHAVDVWTSNAGFTVPFTSSGTQGAIFNDGSKDYVYFGASNFEYGGLVLRYNSVFEEVNAPGFAAAGSSTPANATVASIASFKNAVYAAVASTGPASTGGGKIFRSPTGVAPWTQVFSTGTSGTVAEEAVTALAVFNNQLFAGTRNRTSGASVWSSVLGQSESGWTQASSGGFGLGTTAVSVTTLKAVPSDALYAVTAATGTGKGHLWRSTNGLAWTQAIDAGTTFSLNSNAITAFEYHNGYYYAGTGNSTTGAQVWRTQTPLTANSWTQVYSPDGNNTGSKDTGRFSLATSTSVATLASIGGVLYAGTGDPTPAAAVYRSTDGVTWLVSTSTLLSQIGGFQGSGAFVYAVGSSTGPGQATVLQTSAVDISSPSAVTDFSPTAISSHQIYFTWTAPGNDGTSGTLLAGSSFFIYASTDPNITFYAGGAQVVIATANVVPGASQAYAVPQLLANSTYYSRLFTGDPAQNVSGLSNGATVVTLAQPPNTLATTFLAVYQTSATVAWAAFAGTASSDSSRGYQVEAATAAFATGATVAASSSTLSIGQSTLTISGLAANTTYFFRVASRNVASALNYSLLGSTFTSPAPPAAGTPPFLVVTSSAIQPNWTTGGNANVASSSLTYTSEISTGAYPNTFTNNVSSITRSTSTLFGLNGAGAALTPNTTYFFHVLSTSALGTNAFVSLGSTSTLADAPSASSTTIYTSTITVSWTATNPVGTTNYVEVSTDAFATLNQRVSYLTTAGSLGTTLGLSANTTYYIRVAAINFNSVLTAYSQFTATSTYATQPTSAAATGFSTTSITANWGANGNGSGTVYTVQASSDAYVTILQATTTATSYAFTSLSTSTTYAFQVRARGHNGDVTNFTTLPSTATQMNGPTAAATAFTTVSSDTIAIAWTTSGSPLYAAEIFVNNALLTTSVTANTSAIYGVQGIGALNPSTSYYFQVKSSAGVNSSAYLVLGTTYTLPTEPSITRLVYVSSNAAMIHANLNGNPVGTTLHYQASTDVNFNTAVIQGTLGSDVLLATGLSAKTTYYFRIRGINAVNMPSGYSATVSSFTLPNPPAAPSTPVGTAVGVASISWTWTLLNDATSYNVFAGTTTAGFQGSTRTVSFIQYGLSANATASVQVQGVGLGGAGSNSAAATAVYTLAFVPTSLSSPTINASSVTAAWSLNGNPTGTTAKVERSTDDLNFANVFTGGATYYLDSSLLGCTSYYYRVQHANGDGVAGGYTPSLLFFTKGSTPSAAGSLVADSLTGGRIQLGWTPSPSSNVTQYILYGDGGTGSFNLGAPLGTFTSTVTAFTTGVMTSSASYSFLLRARNSCGVEEQAGVIAQAGAAATLSSVRAAVVSPGAGKHVSGTRVTVSAELSAGAIADVASVLFQYKASSATTWQNIPAASNSQANPAVNDPFYIHWDVTVLNTTNYDLRAVATSVAGSSDTTPAAITVMVDPVNPDLSQTVTGGQLETIQLVSPGVVNTISAADPTSAFVAKVLFSPTSLTASSGTVRVTVLTNPNPPAGPPTGARGANLGLDVTMSTGLAGTARLSLTYPDADDDGVVDGLNIGARQLKFFSYSTALGKWVADVDTTLDIASHTVYGVTSHFSFFSLFAVAAADLNSVRVYPNPWKPSGTNTDEGRAFSASDANSGVIFDNLPSAVTLKIYTLSGQPVAKFEQAAGPGRLQWDGRNDSGRNVASGLYLAVISSPGASDIVKKILIIR
jgi:hypothetical protein